MRCLFAACLLASAIQGCSPNEVAEAGSEKQGVPATIPAKLRADEYPRHYLIEIEYDGKAYLFVEPIYSESKTLTLVGSRNLER